MMRGADNIALRSLECAKRKRNGGDADGLGKRKNEELFAHHRIVTHTEKKIHNTKTEAMKKTRIAFLCCIDDIFSFQGTTSFY